MKSVKKIFPKKLRFGDTIRVIAPSASMSTIQKNIVTEAEKVLQKLGFKVTYGTFSKKTELFGYASISDRIRDIHDAFSDTKVSAVIAADGGYAANQLLPYINYDLIKKNPKIFCGYSDITALLNAIYSQTGMITYLGPLFETFAMKKNASYTRSAFMDVCAKKSQLQAILPSKKWSDDNWKKNQNTRTFIQNKGYTIIQKGSAQGTLIGGNLCTLNLLQGTSYMPSLKDSIVCIEDDDLVTQDFEKEFERNLVSLTQLPDFSKVRGLIIGRFQKKSNMNQEKIKYICTSLGLGKKIPIVTDADFGHTHPMYTLPIGSTAYIRATEKVVFNIQT